MSNLFKKLFIFFSLLICFNFIALPLASAQILNADLPVDTLADETAQRAGFNTVEIGYLIATLIQILLGLLGVVFLVLIISSGFSWMTAQGNEEKVKKATATIKTAVIGLVIVLGAYAITYFLFKYLPFSGSELGPEPGITH